LDEASFLWGIKEVVCGRLLESFEWHGLLKPAIKEKEKSVGQCTIKDIAEDTRTIKKGLRLSSRGKIHFRGSGVLGRSNHCSAHPNLTNDGIQGQIGMVYQS